MTPARRDLLKLLSSAPLAAFAGTAAAQAPPQSPRFERLPGWDFPAVDALLPFGHGVKSGDPLADRVILWTRISIPDAGGWLVPAPQGLNRVDVAWVVARDPELSDVVARGEVPSTAAADWTVKIDVDGLAPATTYWFAFAALGRTSIVGRTRTAPAADDASTPVRLVQTACSKWWAGYFAMYGRIADRNDVDLLLHSGDHIYNKQNANRGTLRLPQAALANEDYEHIDVRDWARPEEVGRRYAFYAADPDLLRAHAALPFVVMPDQHDTTDKEDRGLYGGDGVSNAQAAEQFHLWNADRPVAADGSGRFAATPRVNLNLDPPRGEAARLFYKHLPYGGLVDIITLDMRRSREDGGDQPLLRETQWDFIARSLDDSAQRGARWRVFVNGVSMTQLDLLDAPAVPDAVREDIFGGPDANGVSAYGGWNDDPASRRRLYAMLRERGLIANFVLSGDIHGQFVAELVEDNESPAYVRGTGLGTLGTPVGIELMSGMTSGGADEVAATEGYQAAYGQPPGMDPEFQNLWVPGAAPVARALEVALQAATPNLVYADWVNDCYALLQLEPMAATAEFWQVDKRVPDSGESLVWQAGADPEVMNVQPVPRPTASTGRAASAPLPPPAPAPADRLSPAAAPRAEPRATRHGGGGLGLAALGLALLTALRQRRRP